MDNNNDLHTFLNNWLSNLTFDERTSLLIGACQKRTRINSGIENQRSTNIVALDRLIKNLGCPRDLNEVDREKEHVKYPLEPVVIVVSTDDCVPCTDDSDDDVISTYNELVFNDDDDDDDLPKSLQDPMKDINNTIPRDVQKDMDVVTTVLDLTPASPPKYKESRLRRWRRKTAKYLKKIFTCCVQTDDSV